MTGSRGVSVNVTRERLMGTNRPHRLAPWRGEINPIFQPGAIGHRNVSSPHWPWCGPVRSSDTFPCSADIDRLYAEYRLTSLWPCLGCFFMQWYSAVNRMRQKNLLQNASWFSGETLLEVPGVLMFTEYPYMSAYIMDARLLCIQTYCIRKRCK